MPCGFSPAHKADGFVARQSVEARTEAWSDSQRRSRWKPGTKEKKGNQMEEELEDETKFTAPISNQYGTPYVRVVEERFVIGLEDATSNENSEHPISREFYQAWVKEFWCQKENA